MRNHPLIEYILEDRDAREIILENEDLIYEGVETLASFADIIKNYVMENITDFYDDDPEVMYENIATYSEIATSIMAKMIVEAMSEEMVI